LSEGYARVYVCETINNYQKIKMKNLILSAAVFLTVSFAATASTVEPVVNEKAQRTFVTVFKDADNVTWSNSGNNYVAYFENDGIKTRATIDSKGKLLQTIRYYNESHLPATVLAAIKNDYKGKQIHGITEVTNKNGTNYRIVLKDIRYYTHINANQEGQTELVTRYTRAD
jgi:hypothetical protein